MNQTNPADLTTVGDAMVQALRVNGVDTVFGLPGAQMYPLFDALYQAEPSIRTIGAAPARKRPPASAAEVFIAVGECSAPKNLSYAPSRSAA